MNVVMEYLCIYFYLAIVMLHLCHIICNLNFSYTGCLKKMIHFSIGNIFVNSGDTAKPYIIGYVIMWSITISNIRLIRSVIIT